jgi:hypothetical protein
MEESEGASATGKSKPPTLAVLCKRSKLCTTAASSEHRRIRIESEPQVDAWPSNYLCIVQPENTRNTNKQMRAKSKLGRQVGGWAGGLKCRGEGCVLSCWW